DWSSDVCSSDLLDRDLKELSRNFLFQLLAHLSSSLVGASCKHDKGEGVHFLFIDQDVKLDKLGSLVSHHLIVKGSIPPGSCFQCIKEIVDDLIERKMILQDSALLFNIFHALVDPAALLTQIHDRSDVF